MEERDSRPPTHWLTTLVDRGELPTVPVALYSGGDREAARSAIEAWFAGVRRSLVPSLHPGRVAHRPAGLDQPQLAKLLLRRARPGRTAATDPKGPLKPCWPMG